MSVIIRLQNLPWSANAMDIRNFFRGLSIPEGGVHIVGGEQGDAFIAFSTDEDARQAMLNDCGKIKEVQVKLLLSSRSEMHKVIETARQSVSLLQLAQPVVPMQPTIIPPSIQGLLAQNIKLPPAIVNFSMQPEPQPVPPPEIIEDKRKDTKIYERRSGRSRSKSRERRDRGGKKDKRDRSRSRDRSRDRDRRRRDRSRSRDRRDRRRDRRDRSRDRDRKDDSKRKEEKINIDLTEDKDVEVNSFNNTKFKEVGLLGDFPSSRINDSMLPVNQNNQFNSRVNQGTWASEPPAIITTPKFQPANAGLRNQAARPSRFTDAPDMEQLQRLQELGERRNPNAFQNPDPMSFNNRNPPNNRHNNQMYDNSNDSGNHYDRGVCLKVSNLSPSIRYGDLRKFFSGLAIINQGLKFINDDYGKRTGTAYVRFYKPETKNYGLRRNGQMIMGKPVYITHLDDEEFDNAIDSFRPRNRDSEGSADEGDSQNSLVIVEQEHKSLDTFKILLLEELPTFAKEHDIMKMFSDYSLLSIVIVPSKDGRKQLSAYVQFVNADDAKAALNNKSKHLIGHKAVTVSACSDEAFELARTEQNEAEQEPNNTFAEEPQVSRDPRRRRFDRPDDFQANNFPAAPSTNAMPPRFNWRGPAPGFDRDSRRTDYNNSFEPKLDCVFIKGLPLNTIDRDILDFFADVDVVPTKIHLMLTVHGQPSGHCFCEFLETHEAKTAATKNGSELDGSTVSVELVSRQAVDEARGINAEKSYNNRGGFRGRGHFQMRGGMRGRMRGGPGPYMNGPRGRFSAPAEGAFKADGKNPDSFGIPGCVLSLENVPFRAGIDEVLEFFGDFNLTQTDVIRRFNEKGHPTGDVRVCMRSTADAQLALQQLNGTNIRERKISITLL